MTTENKEDEFEVVLEGEELENDKVENKDEAEDEHEDHHDEEDTRGADDSNDDSDEDEREAVRERRRQERARKKQNQKEREDSLRRELAARDTVINDMRQRLDMIDRRNTGSELAQLENAKKQSAQAYAYFKDQIRISGEAGNFAAQADAYEKMGQAQRKFEELQRLEQSYKQRQAQPNALDPRVVNNAKEWMERNKWYDPSSEDTDNRITLTIDQQLSREGWDPSTKEYWEELDSRVKKYLPHRTSSGKLSSTKPRSVVSGSGRESSSSSKPVYKVSADRVAAMKEAGIWDDPKLRAEAIKRYREYDKQNQG